MNGEPCLAGIMVFSRYEGYIVSIPAGAMLPRFSVRMLWLGAYYFLPSRVWPTLVTRVQKRAGLTPPTVNKLRIWTLEKNEWG
jgi:hypothetical protein